MQNFIAGKIDAEEFRIKFFKIYKTEGDTLETLKKDFEKLEIFEPDPKSKGFSDLMVTVFDDCDRFQPDSTRRENYEIGENQFQNHVKDALLQIQKYL